MPIVRRLSVLATEMEALDRLLNPSTFYHCTEIVGGASVVPKKAGVYAWYFREVPKGVPTSGCVVKEGATLLYVGIAPSSSLSSATLRSRLCQHLRGNAYGSTLRLSLGCLLSQQLEIELRRTRSGRRRTFGPGEAKLSDWIAENARIVFNVSAKPWRVEREIVNAVALPLNLEFNEQHRFHEQLSRLRRESRARALTLPCWPANW